MLGALDIEEYLDDQCDGGYILGSAPIHWVICGGESGPKARPMPRLGRELRDQCASTSVPFLFKQWGDPAACGQDETTNIGGSRSQARGNQLQSSRRRRRLLDGINTPPFRTGQAMSTSATISSARARRTRKSGRASQV